MGQTMVPFNKRIPEREMARRYLEVRKLMDSRSLDLLLISGNSQLSQRGHLRYMTNWTQWLFEEYALFPRVGEIIYFSRYAHRAVLVKSFCRIKDVRFPNYGQHGLGNIPAQQLSEIVKSLKPRVFISSKSIVWVGNTYVITEKGTICLNRADDALIVI